MQWPHIFIGYRTEKKGRTSSEALEPISKVRVSSNLLNLLSQFEGSQQVLEFVEEYRPNALHVERELQDMRQMRKSVDSQITHLQEEILKRGCTIEFWGHS
jgi:hypothetical protein